MSQKNLKIKFVGFWFFILGIISILAILAMGFSIYSYFSLRQSFNDLGIETFSFSAVMSVAGLIFNIPLLAFLSYILFKTRTSLYEFEKEGHKAAFFILIISEISFLLSLIFEFDFYKKNLWSLILSTIVFILNLIFINFLISEKKSFVENKNTEKKLTEKIIVLLLLSFINIPLLYAAEKVIQSPFEAREPKVSSWKTYTNKESNISIDMPANAFYKVYPDSSISFNFKELPATETTLNMLSYAYNQEYDPILTIEPYEVLEGEEDISKEYKSSENRKIFNFKNGIGYINSSSVPGEGYIFFKHNNKIYRIIPRRQNIEKDKYKYTKTATRMLQSLRFIDQQ